MALIGTIADLGLEAVITTLISTHRTGCLKVTAPHGEEVVVYFDEGAVVHAVGAGHVGDEAVVALCGWKDGQMEFVVDVTPAPRNVKRRLEQLMRLGQATGHALRRLGRDFDSEQAVLQWTERPPAEASYTLTPLAWRLLRLLDGVRTVGEVVRTSGDPRLEARCILYEMAAAGFLERIDAIKSLTARKTPPFAGFSILASTDGKGPTVEVDEALQREWVRVRRFSRGVERVRVNSRHGRVFNSRVSFRSGLEGAVVLPEQAFARLAIGEGDKVQVRPIGSRVRSPRV